MSESLCYDVECKHRMKTAPRPVIVRWIDACFQDGSISIRDFDDHCILATCGFLCRETEDTISIGMEFYKKQGTFRRVLHIPRLNILEIKEILPMTEDDIKRFREKLKND